MSDYKILNNYFIYKELESDSIGNNFRAGEITLDQKAEKHTLLTKVYPFFSEDINTWKRINILMEGIKKANIPNIYSPEKIIKEDDISLLAYPYLKGRNLEVILNDSAKKDIPVNFDLTFSIAIAIADLIDIGSSIVVSGKKSFHGFLTPDNIFIDYDGKIILKNYGIYPYLNITDEVFAEVVKKYGAWIAPEFLNKEKLVPQTDIFYLGYIIYRILTGEYFSYSAGEDFEGKFANISFNQHITSSDKDFLTNIINFFKKTLNPDPGKRFQNIKEFKDYISNFFHIEELSSVTFNLAYFMNSLYLESMDEENKLLEKELSYTLPEEKEEALKEREDKAKGELAEEILAGLEEKKPSTKLKFIIPIIAFVVIIIALGGYFYINYTKKTTEKQQQEVRQEMQTQLALLRKQQEEDKKRYEENLKKLEDKEAKTEEEQKTKDDEIKAIQDKLQKVEIERQDRLKKEKEAEEEKLKQEEEKKKLEEEQDQLRKQNEAEEERKKKAAEKKRIEAEQARIKEGDLVAINEITEKPVKIKGRNPTYPPLLRKKYFQHKETIVRAMVYIDENGKVLDTRVYGAIPNEIKDIIIKTLKKWEFQPAKKDNVKVKVWLPIPLKVSFK